LGSIWMFLAEIFFLGVIFVGLGSLVHYFFKQAVDPHDTRETTEFNPLLGRHQDSQA